MSYDIYGNLLKKGYCEVHPDVNEEFPCHKCRDEYEFHQGQKEDYDRWCKEQEAIEMSDITYPTRCRIVDVSGMKIFPGIIGNTPVKSLPHIGKTGLAERCEGDVKITLDDGTVIYGHECWWVPIGDDG